MKKYVLFLISLFFFNLSIVDATIVSSVNVENIYGSLNGNTFLRTGYQAKVGLVDYYEENGQNKVANTIVDSVAFCLDPGASTPHITLKNILTLSDYDLDSRIYELYKIFYNQLLYNNADVFAQRAFFEANLRALEYKYKTITATGYEHCLERIIESNTYSAECFSNEANFNNIKTIYNKMESNLNKVTKFVEPKYVVDNFSYYEDTKESKFSFHLWDDKWLDSKYKEVYLDEKDLTRKISMPQFKINFIDVKYNDVVLAHFNYNDSTNDYNMGYIKKIDVNSHKVNIIFNTEVLNNMNYNNLKVYVNYSWNHPINKKNIAIASAGSGYQRMLVIMDYKETNTSVLDVNFQEHLITEPELSYCKIINDKLYNKDGNEINNFNKYIEDCSCPVPGLIKNESIYYDDYQDKCGYKKNISYTSNFGSCEFEGNTSDIIKTTVEQLNSYCTLTCKENISLNNKTLISKDLSVKAGQYFNIIYPELIATKSCEEKIDIDKWSNDYEKDLVDLVKLYNAYAKTKAFKDKDYYTVSGGCNYDPVTGECLSEDIDYVYYWTECSYKNKTLLCNDDIEKKYDNKQSGSSFSEKKGDLIEKINILNNRVSSLNTCYSYLSKTVNDKDFYNYKGELKFYYQQEYMKDNKLYWNNSSNLSSMDDSGFNINIKSNSVSSNNYLLNASKKFPIIKLDDAGDGFVSDGDVLKYVYYNGSFVENLNRKVEYTITYTPQFEKYINVPTGETSIVKYKNYVELDDMQKSKASYKYYDTDIASKSGNYKNYYTFTSLGENNDIYNYYKNKNILNDYDALGKVSKNISRTCEYKISNDILCLGSECPSGNKELKIVYRVVDSKNIDPNGRLLKNEGFVNWNNEKGLAVKEKIESSDIFNPENLEYSFVLDSKKIMEIRGYNKNSSTSNYSDFMLECNSEGNECLSEFVENHSNSSDGRNNWKYLDYEIGKGYFINKYKRDEISYESLLEKLNPSGGEKILP